MKMTLFEFFVTGFMYILLSFFLGVFLGYVTRKMAQLVMIIGGIIGFAFAIDTAGLVDTGIDWIELFNNVLIRIGVAEFVIGVATFFIQSIERSVSENSQAPAPELTLSSLPSLFILFILIVPFIIGFFKSLHPGPN